MKGNIPTKKELLKMKIGEQLYIMGARISWDITRVPDGWIYSYGRGGVAMCTFVPEYKEEVYGQYVDIPPIILPSLAEEAE